MFSFCFASCFVEPMFFVGCSCEFVFSAVDIRLERTILMRLNLQEATFKTPCSTQWFEGASRGSMAS